MLLANTPPLSPWSHAKRGVSTAYRPQRHKVCLQAASEESIVPARRALEARDELVKDGKFARDQAEALLKLFPLGSSLAIYFTQQEERQEEKERRQEEKRQQEQKELQEKERRQEEKRQQEQKEIKAELEQLKKELQDKEQRQEEKRQQEQKELRQLIVGATASILILIVVVCPPGSPLQNFVIFVLSKLT